MAQNISLALERRPNGELSADRLTEGVAVITILYGIGTTTSICAALFVGNDDPGVPCKLTVCVI